MYLKGRVELAPLCCIVNNNLKKCFLKIVAAGCSFEEHYDSIIYVYYISLYFSGHKNVKMLDSFDITIDNITCCYSIYSAKKVMYIRL